MICDLVGRCFLGFVNFYLAWLERDGGVAIAPNAGDHLCVGIRVLAPVRFGVGISVFTRGLQDNACMKSSL